MASSGFYNSSNENAKSEHVIGNCFLCFAISIVTLSFPIEPAFLVVNSFVLVVSARCEFIQ